MNSCQWTKSGVYPATVPVLGISNLSSRLGRRKNGAPKAKKVGAPKEINGRQKLNRGAKNLRGAQKN